MCNWLWSNGAIWLQRCASTLAEVIACCLMPPNHYLDQCWIIIIVALWHSPWCNFNRKYSRHSSSIIFFNVTNLGLQQHPPWPNELMKCETLRAPIQWKISSYQYRKSNCGDNTILRLSYLHNVGHFLLQDLVHLIYWSKCFRYYIS